MGCEVGCATVSDQSQDSQFVVGRKEVCCADTLISCTFYLQVRASCQQVCAVASTCACVVNVSRIEKEKWTTGRMAVEQMTA